MRGRTLAWLLLLICFTALSCYACEGTVAPQYKALMRRDQLQNVYGMMSESKEKGDRRRLEGVMRGVDLKSLQRAKGISGGGYMLRPRTKSKSGAHTLLLKSSTILSRTFGSAVVGLVMFLVFF
ncbi:hypothetical protein POTOM_057445 [Populus tomentosa]|uniref:Uncharacterized protein n=1 Tax=Populus tomentosa TaxID=118781 RepID=A0A8X7XXN1_POPTO|nr:hypothetical protein POTOM_057445 [Populus tomentosa]